MLMVDLEGLVLGDELLIDGSPYTGKGMEWAKLTHVSPGSASTYPYKVRLSNGATGQYKAEEIRDRRRPDHVEATIVEIDATHPGFRESLVENARTPR